MWTVTTHCVECGAVSCPDLFDTVLALDHSRRPPWGPLHGVTVACYLLQHPSRLPATHRARPLAVLRAYTTGGLDAATRLTEQARQANNHRARHTAEEPEPPPVPPPAAFEVTIADVAGDGTFPAAGFADRVGAWARATLSAWRYS